MKLPSPASITCRPNSRLFCQKLVETTSVVCSCGHEAKLPPALCCCYFLAWVFFFSSSEFHQNCIPTHCLFPAPLLSSTSLQCVFSLRRHLGVYCHSTLWLFVCLFVLCCCWLSCLNLSLEGGGVFFCQASDLCVMSPCARSPGF